MSHHTVIDPSHAPILFLVNPSAGSGAGLKISKKIQTILSTDYPEIQKECTILLTRPNEILQQIHRACENYVTVIAVGGDGTASWILRGILNEPCKIHFGLIPIGTGNDLARSLGLYDPRVSWSDKALRQALHRILSGSPRLIDLFEIEGTGLFCNYVGMGLDAKVLSEYNDLKAAPWFKWIRRSRALKFLCYGALLFKHLGYRLPPGIHLYTESDNVSKAVPLDPSITSILVTNARTYAGGFLLNSASRIDDGLLEVTCVRGLPDIIRILISRLPLCQSLTSTLQKEQIRNLIWKAPMDVPFQWDGELSPVSLALKGSIRIAGQVQVLAPPSMLPRC